MTTKELSKQVRVAQKEFNKWPKRKQRGMIDIDALKKLAESASPGPWARETVQTSCGVCHKIGNWSRNGKYASACIYDDYPSSDNPECAHLEANAAFIASANPKAIIELIAQLEQYKKDAKYWHFTQKNGRPYARYEGDWTYEMDTPLFTYKTAEEAIDAAMKSEKEST